MCNFIYLFFSLEKLYAVDEGIRARQLSSRHKSVEEKKAKSSSTRCEICRNSGASVLLCRPERQQALARQQQRRRSAYSAVCAKESAAKRQCREAPTPPPPLAGRRGTRLCETPASSICGSGNRFMRGRRQVCERAHTPTPDGKVRPTTAPLLKGALITVALLARMKMSSGVRVDLFRPYCPNKANG